VAIAWHHDGSVLASDWLPYAALIALVLAAVLSSSAARFSRPLVLTAALVGSVGLWTAISASWSPVPALARDEFLLFALYGFVLLSQGLGFRAETGRFLPLALTVAALGASAFAVAAEVRFAGDPLPLYVGGRLVAPISYVNAAAALFLVGLWPALVLAARRELHPVVRAGSVAAATAMLAGWMGTQSKGAAVALGVSAIAVFVVLPHRLRLLVPTGIVAVLVFSQYHALTAPFRDQEDVGVVRHAGTVGLVLAAVGFAVGVAYALADRRLEVPERARRLAVVGVAVAGAAALLVGAVAAEQRIDSHSGFVREQWEVFKQSQAVESGSSHLVNLGTNRYDFWRASLVGFEEHPVAGIGGRAFGPWYLRHGESYETPARAHSLPLDVLLETGVIGFLPLLAAFVVVLVALVRRRHTLLGAAAFGAFTYFAVHVTGDWIWTFPAVGLPVFALVGIALSTEEGMGPTGRWAGATAAAVVAFALLLFVPPWLSARITTGVLAGDTSAESLSWAKRLDPLSAEPYLAEAALAGTPEEAIPPLEDAVAKEPRAVSHRYQLGQAFLAVGRRAEARAQLTVAHALFPRDEDIAKALARAAK
jgi:hypothetical protein